MSIRINKGNRKEKWRGKKVSLRRKRAYSQIAKWSKTIDYICDMEIVRVWLRHMEQGEQIRKMENPRESEINQ